jgi:hypothetical protein
MKLKWVAITMALMILAYAVIHAIISFIWMVWIGVIAAGVVLVVFGYFKIKKWLKGDDQQ